MIDIAEIFELNNAGSIAKSIFNIKQKIDNGELDEELRIIKKILWLMESA